MSSSSALYGIVDLGTWTIRFSINSVQPHHARTLPCVFQDRAPIRLYKGPGVPIAAEEIRETLAVLKRFVSICKDYGVPAENVQIAANPHEAPNFDELVAAIDSELRIKVLRLSKEGEHWANAYGVASVTYEARGIYVELRPGYANVYYLSLCGRDGHEDVLIGPVRVYYTRVPQSFLLQDLADPYAASQHATPQPLPSPPLPSPASPSRRSSSAVPPLPSSVFGSAVGSAGSFAAGKGGAMTAQATVEAAAAAAAAQAMDDAEQQRQQEELSHFETALRDACSQLLEQARKRQVYAPTVFLSGSGFYGLHTLLSRLTPGFGLVTTGLVLKPELLRQVERTSRLAMVVRALGTGLPSTTEKVVFVHHNLRNGLLFQALPPAIRYQDPLIVATRPYALPGAPQLAEKLRNALPADLCPSIIRDRLAYAAANSAYIHSSYNSEVQSISALVVAQTGLLASTQGLSHEERILLGLVLCQRWGGKLHTVWYEKRTQMIATLTDPQLAWWARYAGLVLHLLGAAYPGAHVRENAIELVLDVGKTTPTFTLTVRLCKGSIYSDNVIMKQRIERVQDQMAQLGGPGRFLVDLTNC